jgi:hypothetical protein
MSDVAIRPSRLRVIDWYRATTLTTTPLIMAAISLSATTDPNSVKIFSAAVGFLAAWLGWVHFARPPWPRCV